MSAAPPIKINENTYTLKSQLDEENEKIILSCQIISKLSLYYYESSFSLDDMIKLNKNLKICENINEINSFINQSIKDNKITLKNDNEDNLKVIVNIFNIRGSEEQFEINLKKQEKDSNTLIKELAKNVNDLLDENKNLDKKLQQANEQINCLKNIINHRMDSLIINDEDEQLLIENKLKKIKIFSNKLFLSRILYRATIHGDDAKTFHNLCDYKNNLLFLVKTKKNYRFGGFITKMISPSDYGNCIRDDDSFCFSLDLKKVYNCVKGEAIWITGDEIITFLMDIFKIYNYFFQKESICTDAREGNKYIYFDNQESNYEINGGESTFLVQELEVFEIIFI